MIKVPSNSTTGTIFEIELILLGILKHMNNVDLLWIRGVNSYFRQLVTEELYRRNGFRMRFVFCKTRHIYYCLKFEERKRTKKHIRKTTLKKVTIALGKSIYFPCKSFVFSNGTLNNEDLQEFLNLHGMKIESLLLQLYVPCIITYDEKYERIYKFDENIKPPSILQLQKLLIQQVPNAKELRFSECPYEWEKSSEKLFPENEPIYLPNLTSLEIGHNFSNDVCEQLLKSAINLKFLSPTKLNTIVKADKFHLLRELHFHHDDYDSYEKLYESFITVPCLRSNLVTISLDMKEGVKFPMLWNKTSNAITRILGASTTTLRRLNFLTPVGFLENYLKIPKLPYLDTIQIWFENRYVTGKVFPTGLELKTFFLNLSTVVFNFGIGQRCQSDAWEKHFDNFQPLYSVKSITCCESVCSPNWFKNISAVFPNTEFLELNVRRLKFTTSMDTFNIWNFMRLKSLKFHIDVNCKEVAYPAMDAFFTGFSYETCRKLQNASDVVTKIGVEDSRRERQCLLNLPELEFLQIRITDLDRKTKTKSNPILTNVSGFYAFKLMPQLKLRIEYDVENKWNLRHLHFAVDPIYYYAEEICRFKAVKWFNCILYYL